MQRFAQKAPVLITRDTHIGLHVLLGALVLGIAGDHLFRAVWSLNASLCSAHALLDEHWSMLAQAATL